MLKTVRVTEKVSRQPIVYVGKVAAEKLEKQTFSDAIKFLLDHYVIFPPEMISKIQELIKDKHLGFFSKEEFLYEAARNLLKHYSEDIEYIQVHSYLYEKTKNAIEDLNLPFMGVDDFVEEQLKKLHEQHDQWKEQKEIEENDSIE
jgi:hypothetical protein